MKLFISNLLILLLVCLFMQACDLDLQRSFDFDEDARWTPPDPYEVTIFDYMTQEGEFDQNTELDSMVVAVEKAGMESVYSSGVENDKTVFLLRNEAMLEFLDDYGYANISEVPVATLKSLLEYHVIPTRLKQRDMTISKWHTFETLLEGDKGLINLFVDGWWYWEININGRGSPDLPSTAKSSIVRFHNFEFVNGVGHQLINYTQREPFE